MPKARCEGIGAFLRRARANTLCISVTRIAQALRSSGSAFALFAFACRLYVRVFKCGAGRRAVSPVRPLGPSGTGTTSHGTIAAYSIPETFSAEPAAGPPLHAHCH